MSNDKKELINPTPAHAAENRRRADEILDSVKFDGDIDLDREKTREQLGFQDNKESVIGEPKINITDRIAAAKAEAEHRNEQLEHQDPSINLKNPSHAIIIE